jgi:hypothetical protein
MTCIIRCPKCSCHDGHSKNLEANGLIQCDICQKIFPLNRKTLREVLCQCQDCGTLQHVSVESNKERIIHSSDNELSDFEIV